MDIELAKKVAVAAAKEAGKLLNENFQQAKEMSFKGPKDMVTDFDVKAEKIILDAIKKSFPDHAILSEEAGMLGSSSSQYMWVIDPIDGTKNYYYGIDPYRVGICLLENTKPVLNVLYDPTKDELYVAQKSKGAFLNDKIIHVSDIADLKGSVIMLHLSSKKEPRMKTINVLENVVEASMHVKMLGSSLAALGYIASGKFEAYFAVHSKPWDFLPAVLIIEEAGGKVTDIQRNEITAESTSVIASNGKVHDQLVALLKNI